ncbi:hypothetical protein BH11PSE9_BH11PSE9_19550 [soil metagenome]
MTHPKDTGKTGDSAPALAAAAKQAKAVAKTATGIPAKAPLKTAVKKAAKPAAKPAATAPATPAPSGKPKHKLVRDSFTIPKAEYAVLDALKLRAANLKRPTKKSEVLRAGIGALAKLSDKAFLAALESVPVLKTGRPQKALAGKS